MLRTTLGAPHPLGATPAPEGVNFALYSRHATAVDLLLFDMPNSSRPRHVIPLTHRSGFVYHALIPGLGPGQLYGYQVHGPWAPAEGHRFNAHRLLVDPYARALTGKFDAEWLCNTDHAAAPAPSADPHDPPENCGKAPKCVVVDDSFDWEDDRPLRVPLTESVIYEMHVRGFTAHPSSGVKHRGTYLACLEKIDHLKQLGVTAVEFLPVHHCQDEVSVLRRGFANYWGYMTLGYFAPDARFAAGRAPGCQVREFKTLVKELHRAGIEVILDVVYNHTCEQGADGPTLFLRGIDNATYYALDPGDRTRYLDYSGCGNSLEFDEPQVVKLVMDSLRYWVEEMHVDGFRFDLATALGRREGRFTQTAVMFAAIHQDPTLAGVKLIAEPWDVGNESYQLGHFPVDWAEWNGRYRDCVRRFMKGDAGTARELASRFTGSKDLYGDNGRTPWHSVNFITCHDGFTLRDLVSYFEKHNEVNGENNSDGESNNNSWNWGTEGETDDPSIRRQRVRIIKNFLATLLVSQGVPMLSGGDEILRTQQGNNNAYVHDDELSWHDWRLGPEAQEVLDFARMLIAFRRGRTHFRHGRFFDGRDTNADGLRDVNIFGPDLRPVAWHDPERRRVAFLIQGLELDEDPFQLLHEDVMVLFNAHWDDCEFRLPVAADGLGPQHAGPWKRIADTARGPGEDAVAEPDDAELAANPYPVTARSVVVLVRES